MRSRVVTVRFHSVHWSLFNDQTGARRPTRVAVNPNSIMTVKWSDPMLLPVETDASRARSAEANVRSIVDRVTGREPTRVTRSFGVMRMLSGRSSSESTIALPLAFVRLLDSHSEWWPLKSPPMILLLLLHSKSADSSCFEQLPCGL